MSDQEQEQQQEQEVETHEGQVWDAPNQQAVRADQSGPWEEGTGGEPGELPTAEAEQAEEEPEQEKSVDSMTKSELLAYAQEHDVEASDSMTKDEIRKAIDESA